MSLTSELTTAASATPTMNARASARTFALSSHSLNSVTMAWNLHPNVGLGKSMLGARGTGG